MTQPQDVHEEYKYDFQVEPAIESPRLHAGNVNEQISHYRRQVGKGSTFYVVLPLGDSNLM